jgi:deazaflavin-dependent oxidoreductase (nitroreductase family)
MSASQPPLADGNRGRRIKESDRRLIRVFIGAHRRILAASGGRILGRMGGHPLLVLTTTGQRTGQPRSTPVIGIGDGRNWLVVASNGGAATQPLWLRNIAASPQVTIRRGKRAEPFHARILPGSERAEWWPKLVQAYPPYARMQAKTDRGLPVILLTPARTDGQATEPPLT